MPPAAPETVEAAEKASPPPCEDDNTVVLTPTESQAGPVALHVPVGVEDLHSIGELLGTSGKNL